MYLGSLLILEKNIICKTIRRKRGEEWECLILKMILTISDY